MTSDYVTVSIQFSPKCENDEYVVVCSIFGPGMSGFRVINRGWGGGGGNSKAFSPVTGSKKKKTKNPVWIVLSGCPSNGV